MNKYVVGILFGLIAFSCDDGADDSFCHRYEKGTILIGTNEDVSIEQSFDLANGYDLGVESVFGHYYESGLPGDSIQYVVEYLNSKDYITATASKRWKEVVYIYIIKRRR